MTGSGPPEKAENKARQDRLADALRANLRRRKDQKRGRDAAQDQEQARADGTGDNKKD